MKLKEDPAVEVVDLTVSIMWLLLVSYSGATNAAGAAVADGDEGVDKKENPLLGATVSDDTAAELLVAE
jgi:hypothetical protein